jgi:hypothetical protein
MEQLISNPLSSDELKSFADAISDFYANENDGRLPQLFKLYDR